MATERGEYWAVICYVSSVYWLNGADGPLVVLRRRSGRGLRVFPLYSIRLILHGQGESALARQSPRLQSIGELSSGVYYAVYMV
jgi:hypothetical protein